MGYAHLAGGPFLGSAQAYSKILQAVLRRDPRLLSPSTWDLAVSDGLKDSGIMLPRPRVSHRELTVYCTACAYLKQKKNKKKKTGVADKGRCPFLLRVSALVVRVY